MEGEKKDIWRYEDSREETSLSWHQSSEEDLHGMECVVVF